MSDSLDADELLIMDKFLKTSLFKVSDSDGYILKLKETEYIIDFWGEVPCWYYEDYYDNISPITFEEVLKKVPIEIQEKLLFHLDLFR